MADRTRSTSRLDQPLTGRRRLPQFPTDVFGRISERVARFLGTGTFLLGMTVFVAVWITLNVFAFRLRWDPYPFILLNLMFSTQASYAAPLILLAQNRQTDRDRVALEEDRQRAQAAKADTEYLARELAALRLAINEVATREYVRSELNRILEEIRGQAPDPGKQAPDHPKQATEETRDSSLGAPRTESRDRPAPTRKGERTLPPIA